MAPSVKPYCRVRSLMGYMFVHPRSICWHPKSQCIWSWDVIRLLWDWWPHKKIPEDQVPLCSLLPVTMAINIYIYIPPQNLPCYHTDPELPDSRTLRRDFWYLRHLVSGIFCQPDQTKAITARDPEHRGTSQGTSLSPLQMPSSSILSKWLR